MNTNFHAAIASTEIQAVVVDYGEVLCHRPTVEHTARMAAVFGIPASDFPDAYIRSRGPYDRGDLAPVGYWQQFARAAGTEISAGQIAELRAWDLEMWSLINDSMTSWVARIQAIGIKTAILSNMHSDMAAHARAHFGWLRKFDHHVFSCEVRAIKPDPMIYEVCLQRLQSQPSETLFIDDREENLQGARECGMVGIRFSSVGELSTDLQAIKFPILPTSADRTS
jgi:putative hydrolase of the HAD superfamily